MNIKDLWRNLGVAQKKAEQALPVKLTSAVRFPYGAFKFKATVPKGVICKIEASSNLKNWSAISEQSSPGELEYVDSNAPNFGHRFYRLQAETSWSTNVIGYASVIAPPGFSMIANPFVAGNDSVGELLKEMPEGATLSKYDAQLSKLTENKIQGGKWSKPAEKLVPGEGALFFNPTSDYKTLNFFGEVKQGKFSVPIPAGFSIRSSLIPQPGRLHADLGFPVTEGDVIHLFDKDSQKYVLYPYDPQKWAANPPVVSVGESFWVAKTTGKNWSQSLVIGS